MEVSSVALAAIEPAAPGRARKTSPASRFDYRFDEVILDSTEAKHSLLIVAFLAGNDAAPWLRSGDTTGYAAPGKLEPRPTMAHGLLAVDAFVMNQFPASALTCSPFCPVREVTSPKRLPAPTCEKPRHGLQPVLGRRPTRRSRNDRKRGPTKTCFPGKNVYLSLTRP